MSETKISPFPLSSDGEFEVISGEGDGINGAYVVFH